MATRRQFLASTSAVCAIAALPKSLLAQRLGGQVFTNASLGAYQQGLLTMENFKAVIGSTFKAFLDDASVAYLTLESVTATPAPPAPANPGAPPSQDGSTSMLRFARPVQAEGDSFSLSFATGNTAIAQDTYLVDHGTMGRFAVFLVPGSAQSQGNLTCTATFNYIALPRDIAGSPIVVLRNEGGLPGAAPGRQRPVTVQGGEASPILSSGGRPGGDLMAQTEEN